MRAHGAPREVWVCVPALVPSPGRPRTQLPHFHVNDSNSHFTGAVEVRKEKCLACGRCVEVIQSMRCGTPEPCRSGDGEEAPSPLQVPAFSVPWDNCSPRLSGSLCRFGQVHSTGVTCYLISRGCDTSLSRGRTPGLERQGASQPSGQRLLCLFPAGLYVLVGAGALMMAVGFFGCCGAMRESQCVLGSAIRHVQTMYEEAYNDYLTDRERGNGTLITFHSTFQCCGKESSEQVQPTCPKELLGPKNCIDEIEAIISVKLQLIGIVGIGIAGLTIFGMIFSMVLCCAIRTSRDVI
uniref:Tetraspanin-2 n=1 Tax=Ailuropoda melanoleuca TaxID=9646 RepID=A0A7N5KN08_AILME